MQKRIALTIVLILLFSLVAVSAAGAEGEAYCVMPMHANTAVSEQNADTPLGAAGLSKLPAVLTLCRAFDRALIAPDAAVSVSRNAAKIGGPTAFLQAGETIAAEELIRAAVMISAGDAIWALMEHAFGSEDVFCSNIALTLRSLGMERDVSDCLGTNELYTCRELLKLGEAAAESETFLKYCAVRYAILNHADGRETELASANKLLTSLSGCIGLFTGSSRQDGYCGVFACKRGGTVFLCTVLGAADSSARFRTATKLLEEAFANYKTFPLCSTDMPFMQDYPVENGDMDTVDLYPHEDVSLLLNRNDGEPKHTVDLPETLTAPLDPDFAVGSVTFYGGDGAVLCEIALYPEQTVCATGFTDIFKRILIRYVSD